MTKSIGVFFLSLLFLLNPACTARPAATPPADIEILIPAGTYEAELKGTPGNAIPSRITLQTGQSVVIKNDDYAMHYLFDLPISPGQTARKTFLLPGKFVYTGGLSCSVNRDAGLTVEVLTPGSQAHG